MNFVPNCRRISASRMLNNLEKLIHSLKILSLLIHFLKILSLVIFIGCIQDFLFLIFEVFGPVCFFEFMSPWGLSTRGILSERIKSKLTTPYQYCMENCPYLYYYQISIQKRSIWLNLAIMLSRWYKYEQKDIIITFTPFWLQFPVYCMKIGDWNAWPWKCMV